MPRNHRLRAYHRPHLRVLSDFQIERLYKASLTCLERTGVNMLNPEARRLLVDAGAEAEGVTVRIPRGLIDDALSLAPSGFELWPRPVDDAATRPEPAPLEICAADLESGNPDCVHFGPGLTCTYFLDPETGQRRKSRRGDPAAAAKVCDSLPNFDYVMGLGLIDDVAPELAPVYEFAEMTAGTNKPAIPWAYTVDTLKDIYQIAVAIAGDEKSLQARPFFALFATSQAPMQHTNEDM